MSLRLRQTVRHLLRSRGFVCIVIATLGVGIGLNAAIFTVVDCVLLRPLGYRDADRIVGLTTHFTRENRSVPRLGGDDYNDIARQVHGLEATAFYNAGADGISVNGTSLYLPVATVSPRFGEVMGVEPVAGRLFNTGDTDGHDALVNATFAREHFGSAAAALGQVIHYNAALHTVVGVLPAGFSFPEQAQVWIETKPTPDNPNRTAYNQRAIGKRRADVTPSQLAAEFATLLAQLQHAYPEDRQKSLGSAPLQDQIVGQVRPTLNLLMGSVAVILLIVCSNITHLQLVRATREMRAVTIRTALGATRRSLALHALSEAVLLALGGTMAALALAIPGLRLLIHLAPPALPRLADVHLNADVFIFSFVASFVVMALTALLPVWRSWHVDPATALRQDASRGTESRRSMHLRNGLIMAEVALTFTLSVTAILLTRQLIAQGREDLGFSPQSLITLDTHVVERTSYPDPPTVGSPAAIAAYRASQLAVAQASLTRLDATLDSLAHTPGVLAVSAIDGAPMGFGGSDVGYAVKGRQVFAPPFQNLQNANIRAVTPGLFSTMGIPLVLGRGLDANDRIGAPPVLLIDETLARTIFPNQDPIGKQVMCGYDEVSTWWTIVGVVGSIHNDAPGAPPAPTFYVPVAQHPDRAEDLQIVVRAAGAPAAMTETLRNTLRIAHPELSVKATTMLENIGETQRADQFRSLLFASFAGVSILLAAIGIYGVTAYTVAQRRFEFGLRFALGANRSQVLQMVLNHGLTTACVGLGLGIGITLVLMRLLSSVLGKLPTFDPGAYGIAICGVLLIAFVATLIPARRAATIDPMQALRTE